MFDPLDSTEPFYTETTGAMTALFLDIELLDSTAARTALITYAAWAYDGPLTVAEDGLPYPIRQLN
jgi:hypothetical protein